MATPRADTPRPSEPLGLGLLAWVAGPAVLAPIFPGFLLCLPGFIFAALILIPVIAVAVVLAIPAAIVGLFVLLVRSARRHGREEPPRAHAPSSATDRRAFGLPA